MYILAFQVPTPYV